MQTKGNKWCCRNTVGNVGLGNSDVASIFSDMKLSKDERRGFQLYEEAFGSSDEPDVRRLIAMYLMGEYSIFLQGWDKEVIAFAIIKHVGDMVQLKTAHVEYLCVDSALRSQGLGGRFVKEIVKHYLQMYNLLTLQCSDDLIGFYRRNGFEVLSTESYWQRDRYNMMFVADDPNRKKVEKAKEKIANGITEKMNREVWQWLA